MSWNLSTWSYSNIKFDIGYVILHLFTQKKPNKYPRHHLQIYETKSCVMSSWLCIVFIVWFSLVPACRFSWLKREATIQQKHISSTSPFDAVSIRQRPYFVEYTRSHPNSEVKRRKARSVLGWGTAREALRVLLVFLFFKVGTFFENLITKQQPALGFRLV